MKATLSASDVRRLFTYEEDGRLLWAVKQANKVRVGASAGHFHVKTNTHIITIDGGKHPRARLVFAWHHGRWPTASVWHRNRNSSDDRIDNLIDYASPDFPAALQQRDGHLMGATPVPGGWQANSKAGYVGKFDTEAEAHEAFKNAHIMKFGTPAAPGVHKC